MRGALLPRFSLNHTQIRGVLTVTAFEKAMQEIHGEKWKDSLNRKQKDFVEHKERGREEQMKKMQQELGDKWEAAAAEETARQYASEKFQDKLKRIKKSLEVKSP